jgi:plastocyanin
MKKIFVVLAILFIGILLAGCTSQPPAPVATPVPTPVPTAVVTTVPPTPVPTTAVVVVNTTATPKPTPTPTPTPQPSVMITFTSTMTIIPGATVTVPVGGKIVWKNDDPFKPHGIRSTGVGTQAYFGDVVIPYRGTFNVTFDKVGSFDYVTTFQPQASGQIIVTK